MIIRGKVIEGMTGEPLVNASISIVDKNFVPVGVGVVSDERGLFSLNSSRIDGNKVLVSYQGLESTAADPELLAGALTTEIPLFPRDLQTVVVTPGNNPKLRLLMIPAILLAMYLLTRKRKTKK